MKRDVLSLDPRYHNVGRLEILAQKEPSHQSEYTFGFWKNLAISWIDIGNGRTKEAKYSRPTPVSILAVKWDFLLPMMISSNFEFERNLGNSLPTQRRFQVSRNASFIKSWRNRPTSCLWERWKLISCGKDIRINSQWSENERKRVIKKKSRIAREFKISAQKLFTQQWV